MITGERRGSIVKEHVYRTHGQSQRWVVLRVGGGGEYTERKKELLPFATARMDLERTMLSEISQVVQDKYHMISPVSGT